MCGMAALICIFHARDPCSHFKTGLIKIFDPPKYVSRDSYCSGMLRIGKAMANNIFFGVDFYVRVCTLTIFLAILYILISFIYD